MCITRGEFYSSQFFLPFSRKTLRNSSGFNRSLFRSPSLAINLTRFFEKEGWKESNHPSDGNFIPREKSGREIIRETVPFPDG